MQCLISLQLGHIQFIDTLRLIILDDVFTLWVC